MYKLAIFECSFSSIEQLQIETRDAVDIWIVIHFCWPNWSSFAFSWVCKNIFPLKNVIKSTKLTEAK